MGLCFLSCSWSFKYSVSKPVPRIALLPGDAGWQGHGLRSSTRGLSQVSLAHLRAPVWREGVQKKSWSPGQWLLPLLCSLYLAFLASARIFLRDGPFNPSLCFISTSFPASSMGFSIVLFSLSGTSLSLVGSKLGAVTDMGGLGPWGWDSFGQLMQGYMCSGSGQLLTAPLECWAARTRTVLLHLWWLLQGSASHRVLLYPCHAQEQGRKSSRASCRLSKHIPLP